jgi:ribosomal protein S18 acetylase RimI-like enzyme
MYERDKCFAKGEISEKEIKEHWENPENPLFKHELTYSEQGNEKKFAFFIRALTENYKDSLLAEIEDAWAEIAFEELQETLNLFFEQRKVSHPTLVNVEYYIATDENDKPVAMTGIYTVDIRGEAGFATRDRLKPPNHHMVTSLGWFAVSTRFQKKGLGGYLLKWTERMAKFRGAVFMTVETDNSFVSDDARRIYEKNGYRQGLDIKNYFGPGRNLVTYYCNVANEKKPRELYQATEQITLTNQAELLSLAKEIYSEQRFEEFKVCLDLVLQQQEMDKLLIRPFSLVQRDADGKVNGFAIITDYTYSNSLFVFWAGADPHFKKDLVRCLKGFALVKDKDVLVLSLDKEDPDFLQEGFLSAKDGVPGVFSKKKAHKQYKMILYSKELTSL